MRSKPELWEYAPVERARCPDPLLAAYMLSGDATVATLRALASTKEVQASWSFTSHIQLSRAHRATLKYLRVSSALCVTPSRLQNRTCDVAPVSDGKL
jgi:hypothetical protein